MRTMPLSGQCLVDMSDRLIGPYRITGDLDANFVLVIDHQRERIQLLATVVADLAHELRVNHPLANSYALNGPCPAMAIVR